MAVEREAIMGIRYQVDAYDEEHLFNNKASHNPDTGTPTTCSHVQLGSLKKVIHLGSYAKMLGEAINLQALLIPFLRLSHVIGVGVHTASGFKVWTSHTLIIHMLMFVKVVPCHALQVTYTCQETAVKKTDLLRVTASWRGSGPRHDYAILQGSGPSGLVFCQVCAIFMILIGCEWYRLAVVRIYKQKRRNKRTGHIELIVPKDGSFDLCFVDSIIRIAHILQPNPQATHSIVQDLYDGDMYLRLHHIQ